MPRPDTSWHGPAVQHTVPADYIYGFMNAFPSRTEEAGKDLGAASHPMAPGPPLDHWNTAVTAPTCQYGFHQTIDSAGHLNAHASNNKNSSFIHQSSLFDRSNSLRDPNKALVEGDAPTYFGHTGHGSKMDCWGSNMRPQTNTFELDRVQGLNPGPCDTESAALPMLINGCV